MLYPVRDLSGVGVIKDLPPYDLPPNAWSEARNVRFGAGRVTRFPHFLRDPDQTPLPADPIHAGTLPETSVAGGQDRLFVFASDGTIHQYIGASGSAVTSPHSDLFPLATAPTVSVANDVLYYNRADTVPIYYTRQSDAFASLPGWDEEWRCRALRSYAGYLIALGLTKGGQEIPTMVKWSTETSLGTPPSSWDHTDPSLNAGENILPWARTTLVDAQELNGILYLFSEDGIYRMRSTGGSEIFVFEPFVGEGYGAISQNCVVSVGLRQYVFGPSDIYVHDGYEPKSLVEGRVRDYIYSRLEFSRRHLCFVFHYVEGSEVWFCYPSASQDIRHPAVSHCNEAAVFNYLTEAWSFVDLPNVIAVANSNYYTDQTWDAFSSSSITWDGISGTWAVVDEDPRRFPIALSAGVGGQPPHLYPAVVAELAPSLNLPVAEEALADFALERRGLDLDDIGAPLQFYWGVRGIYPQVVPAQGSITFQAGSSMETDDAPLWGPVHDLTPGASGRVDVLADGRYVAIRVSGSGPSATFTFTGYDLDLVQLGRR